MDNSENVHFPISEVESALPQDSTSVMTALEDQNRALLELVKQINTIRGPVPEVKTTSILLAKFDPGKRELPHTLLQAHRRPPHRGDRDEWSLAHTCCAYALS